MEMVKKSLIFAVFAAATLVAMLREWSAPASCPVPGLARAISSASDK